MKPIQTKLMNANHAIIALILFLASLTVNAQFTSGRLVVARYGATGQASPPTSAGTPTFLDEYSTLGAPGFSLALPTTTLGFTNRILSSGSATSEGQLNLSSDGTVLLLGGYDAAAGTATINSTAGINRVVARIDNSGAVSTTVLTTLDATASNNSYTTSNFRSVASSDGTRYWTGGNGTTSTGGVRTILYGGSTVSPAIASQVSNTSANVRVVKIFNGQLYYSTAGGIFKVGTGLPTSSGTTSTALFTMQAGNSSPYSFVFLDRDPSVPGPDVMYVADDGTGASGVRGIFKYYFNGSTWTSLGSSVHTVGISGLTGVVTGGTAELYGTTSGSIVKFVDFAAFNATISGSFNTMVTAPTNTFFRGIAFAPSAPCVGPTISGITTNAPICASGTLNLSVSPAGTAPFSYTWAGPGSYSPSNTVSNPTVVGAATGVYTVTVSNGCGLTSSTTSVLVYSPLSLSPTNTNVTCFGGNNGTANANASGGSGPYSYTWIPSGGSGPIASGLSANVYTVTVSDASCGAATATINITQPSAALSGSTFVINDANCLSIGDGRIGTTVNNAVGTVHYAWSPSGGTGSQATGLLAGIYTVSISDDCSSFTSTQTIAGPSVPMSISCIPGSDVTCFGGNNGSASVSVFNSVGTVGYSWSPSGGSGPTASGLSAGTYTVTVTDYCATPTTCSVTIAQPSAALSVTCASTDESSPGANDGSASVSTSGGSGGPLSYLWAPSGGTNATAPGLAAGIYTVVVTDGACGFQICTTTVGSGCLPSTPATSASASSSEICSGNNVNLSLTGGSLGTGADWKWYEGGCGAGSLIGTGASITTGAITGAGVHTFYVRAEGTCGTTSCVSVSVNVTVGSPAGSIGVISFPAVGCVGGSGTITATTVPNATGYSWSGPVGILFDGNPSPYVSSSPSVTLTYTALPPAGISGWNVCVFAKNACGNGPNTKCSWIRATLSTPALSGSSIACAGGSETYIVGPVDGAASYTWTITGDATLNGAGTTVTTAGPSVNANFGAGFTGGQICVFASTACGTNSGVRCISITNAPPLPGAISGASTICPGTGGIYSIPSVAGAASYNWSVTGSGISVIGAGTNASVSTISGFTSGSVCVIAVSGCGSPAGNSAQRCKTISSGKLGTPGNITGDPTAGVCGQTYTYTIPSMTGATGGYAWSIPGGATGSSSSNSITITFPSVFVSGTVCVHGINACGAGSDRCITVYGNPSTPSSLSGNSTPCAGSDEVYTWPAVPGASQYQVIVPVGYTVLSGTPTISNMAVINVTGASGQIGVKAVNACGVSGTRTLLINPTPCRMSSGQQEIQKLMGISVFPNPAHDNLNIEFNSTVENSVYQLDVMDLSGRIINSIRGESVSGRNLQMINLNGFSAGMYLLQLGTSEGNQTIRFTIE